MTQRTIEVQAPAKINICLSIKHKRQDGYHELETVMQKIDLADRVRLRTTETGISLQCKAGKGTEARYRVPDDETNLASRAAESFFSETGCPGGVDIHLEKNIPVAAGLGGGSSDAGAVLSGLSNLFPGRIAFDRLLALAGKLGADVPFFVHRADAVFAGGRGDVLEPIASLKNCFILLVNPGFSVSTKWVYDNFALTYEDNTYTLAPDFEGASARLWFSEMGVALKRFSVGTLTNDLERVTEKRFSEITWCKKQLLVHGAEFARMSGSGPTVFGIFSDKEKALQSFALFKEKYADVFLSQPYNSQDFKSRGW